MRPSTPRPGTAAASLASGGASPRLLASRSRPRAMGWVLADSRPAAQFRASSGVMPGATAILSRAGSGRVRVPVLSK